MKDIYGSIDETDEAELNKDIEKLYMATDFQVLTDLVEEAIRRLENCFAGKTQTAHREVELVKQYIYRNYGSELGLQSLCLTEAGRSGLESPSVHLRYPRSSMPDPAKSSHRCILQGRI